MNFQSQLNGGVANKNTLLLEFDPEAPSTENPTNTDTPSPNDPFKQFVNLSSQQDNKAETLLDFEGSSDNTNEKEQDSILSTSNNSAFDITSPNADETVPLVPQSNEREHQLLNQANQDFDDAAQALASKIDLVTSPSPPATTGRQPPPSFDTEQKPVTSTQSAASPKLDSTVPTASPAKKSAPHITRPTSASKTKPTSTTAATSKTTEHKPITAAAGGTAASKSAEPKPAASTTKSTESKPSTTARKTIHSTSTTSAAAAASNKPKITPTSPIQESSTVPKPTVNITKLI